MNVLNSKQCCIYCSLLWDVLKRFCKEATLSGLSFRITPAVTYKMNWMRGGWWQKMFKLFLEFSLFIPLNFNCIYFVSFTCPSLCLLWSSSTFTFILCLYNSILLLQKILIFSSHWEILTDFSNWECQSRYRHASVSCASQMLLILQIKGKNLHQQKE